MKKVSPSEHRILHAFGSAPAALFDKSTHRRMNIDIDDRAHLRLKIMAAAAGKTMGKFLEDLINSFVSKEKNNG